MPIELKTQTAKYVVREGTLTESKAAELEKLAEAAKDMGAALKTLGFSQDSFATAVDSPAVQRLSPKERELFVYVYGEMLNNVSSGLSALGGKPTQQEIRGAYEEVSNVIEKMQRRASAHGPGVTHVAPSSPDFKLDDHPEQLLRHGYRVKGDVGDDPHILVTFSAQDLGATRSHYDIASSDLTPEAFVAALRKSLGGAFANVELRARSEDGGPVAVSKPGAAAPAAPAETRQQKFQRAAAELTKAIDTDPVLAGRVTKVFQHTAELMPSLGVHTSIPEGPAFNTLEPQIQEAIASWLEKNGHADLVDRGYLGNTIMVAFKGGGLGV